MIPTLYSHMYWILLLLMSSDLSQKLSFKKLAVMRMWKSFTLFPIPLFCFYDEYLLFHEINKTILCHKRKEKN